MAPQLAPWLQRGIAEYRSRAGDAEHMLLNTFICSPEAAQAFAELEALGQEGPASELRVVEYLLPRVSGRRGDGMTAQQLKESIEPEATTDDEKYEVVVEKIHQGSQTHLAPEPTQTARPA
uniref:Uncharacterized protein n=1 Tax=Dunaliella tertiolecta TaxID=3047 RepID=A0A7S3R9F7_DUNTE